MVVLDLIGGCVVACVLVVGALWIIKNVRIGKDD